MKDASLKNDWKNKQRHPLSAEYGDLEGAAWDDFLAHVKKYGIVGQRKITIYEDKILDGWQLQRACVVHNIQPAYQVLPKGVSPEGFVATVNDRRRHESAGKALERIAERRDRVAARRAAGETTRDIAKSEGVSESQVRRDLAPQGAEEDLCVTTNENRQNSTNHEPIKKSGAILCDRCQRVGAIKNCPNCKLAKKEAAAQKKAAQEAKEDEQEAPKDLTIEEQIKAKNSELERWCRGLMEYAKTMPDDPWLQDLNRREGALKKLKNCCETIRSAKCHCPCPKCSGDGCRECHQTGRVTKYAFDQMEAA